MVSVVAVTARVAGVVGWKSESAPPLRVIAVVVANGVVTLDAKVPPPLMVRDACELLPIANKVPSPVLVRTPVPKLIFPLLVKVTPDAMSKTPPSLLRLLTLRLVAKEEVTRRAAGTVAPVALKKYKAPFAEVSPKAALLATLTTPALIWSDAIEFNPPRTIVPWPVLKSTPEPLILLDPLWIRANPAPMSKLEPVVPVLVSR